MFLLLAPTASVDKSEYVICLERTRSKILGCQRGDLLYCRALQLERATVVVKDEDSVEMTIEEVQSQIARKGSPALAHGCEREENQFRCTQKS